MGYLPAPLATPWAMLPDDRYHWNTNATTLTANSTYICASTLQAQVTVANMRYRFGTGGAGNCDVGIYDSSGNRLAHTGSVATATGIRTTALTAALTLSPGRYYLAFWIDNATDTVRFFDAATGLVMTSWATTGAGGLPSSITPPLANVDGSGVGVIGLLSGGWS